MMKARMWVFVALAWGAVSAALTQEPVQLKFSRVVDLTLPIESNMAGIPGLKDYAENPSRVAILSAVLVALPLKIKGGDASPARVVALVE
jgi:kynurenine formamidase